jgi:hypothetical protein
MAISIWWTVFAGDSAFFFMSNDPWFNATTAIVLGTAITKPLVTIHVESS